jgi:hypothetical protein
MLIAYLSDSSPWNIIFPLISQHNPLKGLQIYVDTYTGSSFITCIILIEPSEVLTANKCSALECSFISVIKKEFK